MKYFESDVPSGDGLCSDNNCPCPEVLIPRGTGYLYIKKSLVDFRKQCPTLESARKLMQNRHKQATANLGGALSGFYSLGPILVCEQGAKLRNLNLEVSSADAKKWWETGLVPLRETPIHSDGSGIRPQDKESAIIQSNDRELYTKSKKIQLSKSVTDAIFDNLETYDPVFDLALTCPKCGEKPLPEKMVSHLYAVGCSTIVCKQCDIEIPLVTDLGSPCQIFSTDPLEELDFEPHELIDLGKSISLSKNNTSNYLEDVSCIDSFPSIKFAKNFYDGSERGQKFSIKILPFREHLDILCNLTALKTATLKCVPIPSKKTLQCFNRLANLFLLAHLNPVDSKRYNIPNKLVDNWKGLVWNFAYLLRALSQAEKILRESTKTKFTQDELKQSLFSKYTMPSTDRESICALDFRRLILERIEQFFCVRFLTLLEEKSLTKGGYETFKIAECIKNAFLKMGIDKGMMLKCMEIRSNRNDPSGADECVKNAALISFQYRIAAVDIYNFREFSIGKLSPESVSFSGLIKKFFRK